MDEIQKWYCEVCMKYSLNREDLHLITKNHKINQSRLDCEAVYKEYIMRRYQTLMGNTEISPLSKYLKKSVLVYRKLKKDFKLFYDSDCDSDSDSDSDCDSDSDDENTKYQDYVESRYNHLMKNNIYMCLSEFLEKRARVYKLIKTEFNRNYKVP